MRRKLRRRTGFTLVETLITIFLLALVTAAGTVGVTAVLAERNRMIQVADAQILASTAAEAIADELRFGRNIEVGTDHVTMDSSLFDTGSTLRRTIDASRKTPGNKTVPAGRLIVERSEAPAGGGTPTLHVREVLGDRSYNDLHFSALTFAPGATTDGDATVTVTLTVANNNDQDLWSVTFSVVPLNGAKTA